MGERQRVTSSAEETDDFAEVLAAHRDRVYRTILRLVRDSAEAQDLTQETFVRAFQGVSGFRGRASLGTWILRIARNVVVDRYRRRARRLDGRAVSLADPGSENVPEAASLTPAHVAEQRLSSECVQQCVDAVPEPYRRIVQLHDLEGLSNPEIAESLGLSLETVKMRVHRGRERLRATFQRSCEVYRDERNELACRPKGHG